MTRRIIHLVCLACLLGHGAASAQSVETLASQLGSSDRGEVRDAVEALGNADDELAIDVLSALDRRELRVAPDGRVVIKDRDSGDAPPPDAELQPIVITNALRRALGTSLAKLQLRSQERDMRLEAARVLAESPAPEMADLLRESLGSERDARVKQQIGLALAKIDLTSDNRSLRLSALQTIGDRAELSLKPELQQMLRKDDSGAFLEQDVDVRKAARQALSAVERKELMVRVVRDLFYGISLGSVLLLAALGLAITFGLMGVINMAHGEMLMLGAYSTFVVQNLFSEHVPGASEWYLAAAVPVAFAVCFAVGVVLERTVIRFLYGRPLETLLATWGISLGLIQVVRLIFGAQNVTVANPDWLSGGYELVSGVVLPYTRLLTILFVVVVVSFVWYVLNATRLGLEVRAITQNRRMARCMGIRAARVDMATFGIGSGVAGLGGVALSQIGNVGPELGQGYIVDSFMVVVLGGVGKIMGTVVAALGLGTVNKVLEPLSGAVLGKIFVLAFVILFIQRRPQGLFAVKGRAAES